ncbi:Solute carrier family 12 protein, partial [Trichinella spiralis]
GAASVSILATSPREIGRVCRVQRFNIKSAQFWTLPTGTDGSDQLQLQRRQKNNGMLAYTVHIPDEEHLEINYNHPFLAHTYFTPVVDKYRENQSIIPLPAED